MKNWFFVLGSWFLVGAVALAQDEEIDHLKLELLELAGAPELTIASGAITATSSHATVDTEGDAGTDDLDTITPAAAGVPQLLWFYAADAARDIVIKHNTGNILTQTGADLTLDELYKVAFGIYDPAQSKWIVNLGNGGAGGSSLPVADTTSIAEGSADATKEVRFEVDGITTATVRVLTMPDFDVDLGALTAANLAAESVGSSELANDAVDAAAIDDNGDAPGDGDVLTWNTGAVLSWEAAGAGSGAFSDAGDPIVPNTPGKDLVLGANMGGVAGKLEIGSDDANQPALVINGITSNNESLIEVYAPDAGSNPVFDIFQNGHLNLRRGTIGPAIVSLYEDEDNGTHRIDLDVPADLAGTLVYTLPGLDGVSGEAIITDGNGNLSFSAIGGGAPTDAQYWTAAADATLSAEVVVNDKATLQSAISDVADFAEADGDTFTGVHDFGGATSIEIVNGATPTVDAAGEVAIDTTITNHTGLVTYHDGAEALFVVAVPTANLTSTGGHVVSYNATNDEFEMTAAGAADNLGNHIPTQDVDFNDWDIMFNNAAGIRDSSGVKLLDFFGVASAVNYIRVTNEGAGSAPHFSTLGSDVNIPLQFQTKGTADFEFLDNVDITGTITTSGTADFGAITSTGTITATVGFDIVGAADMDYGSVDVTDHRFVTDGTGDGEIVLPNDSIGDGEIDWGTVTGADITLTDAGAITSTGTITATVGFDIVGAADMDYGSVDVTDHTFVTDGTGDAEIVLPNDSIGDGEIDWGTVTGADITLTDAGAITSTGTITATVGFDIVGAADMDYGSVDVTDHTFVTDGTGDAEIVLPDNSIGNDEIDWDTVVITSTGTITATVGFDIVGAADMDYGSVDVLDHTFVTDGTGDAEIVLPNDSIGENEIDWATVTGADITLTDAGAITSTGTITATVGFDVVGIADIDYGSADVTDHTFVTDGTGDGEIVLPNDSIGDGEIDWATVTGADITLTDAGAITSTGTITATVGFDIVGAADMDYGSVDVTDHTFVTDGTGDAEIVLPNDSIGENEIDWATVTADDITGGTLAPARLGANSIDAITELAAGVRSGADVTVITGTAGTNGDLAQWNVDGDLVDGPTPPTGAIVGTTDAQTVTNKTIDADDNTFSDIPEVYYIYVSPPGEDVTTGTRKSIGRAPHAMTVTSVQAWCDSTNKPTGAGTVMDINEDGVSILSTKITIEATEDDSADAVTAPVVSDSALAAGAELTVDFDSVGTTTSGRAYQIAIFYTRNY